MLNLYISSDGTWRLVRLRDAARQFIEAEFGNEPFVAAHVRPYPDACARTWAKAGDLPKDQLLHPFCDNGGLAFDLAPTLKDVMERHSAKRLFVLTPPSIRHRVDTLLAHVSGRMGCIAWAV